MTARAALAPVLACLALPPGQGATVRIRNDFGGVVVRAVMGAEKPAVQSSGVTRPARPDDVRYSQERGIFGVECRPADGARVDLDVTVPHTVYLEVTTRSGGISISGLVRDANLVTDTGAIRLAVPWRLATLSVRSLARPKEILLPDLDYAEFPYGARQGYWTFLDAPPGFSAAAADPKEPLRYAKDLDRGMSLRGYLYGSIRVRGNALERLVVSDIPVGPGSWIRLPGSALEILDGYLAHGLTPAASIAPPRGDSIETRPALPRFVAQVRMVNLTGPVYDDEGRPVPGLKAEDFEVLEDGAPQIPAYVGSDEPPFNLILLLDLSATTLPSRTAQAEAARQFAGIARPEDRVAIYALGENLFQVISPLTTDRARLMRLIDGLPALGGTSPLYDAIVLAMAQEALQLPGEERTALVVITDGVDNSLHTAAAGSRTSFDRLLGFVRSMPVLVYPILLPAPSRQRPFAASEAVIATVPEARRRMQLLAEASGGRLFDAGPAFSMRTLYPLVADELRHVYTVAYYPRRHDLDGRWRRVAVKVKRPGVTFRTREGYYAR